MAEIIIEVVPAPIINVTLETFAGTQGPVGPAGPAGQGVPVGGTTGQVLAKIDSTNYNTQWVTPPSSIVAALIFG
jgi:hypothetical protein